MKGRRPTIAPLLAIVFVTTFYSAATAADRPNVLFIVVDDLNDWTTLFDTDAPIKTPNLERLAKRGVFFTHAYCASPACNPSRVATLTGLRPTSTGVYGNRSDWRYALPNRPTIMQRFRAAGYDVRGAGKIFHHHLDGAFHDTESFDEFQPMARQNYPSAKLSKSPDYGSRNTDWGAWPQSDQDAIDYKTADYCIASLADDTDRKPFFLACGIFKPHSPFFAPESWHQPYQDIPLPNRNANDWDDLPSGADALMKPTRWFWHGMMNLEVQRPGSYQAFIRSYAACASFADDQIGRVLDALDQSGHRRNTIVVLWSDHGFHLGEKDHIEKFALWEQSNHVPLIIVDPTSDRAGSTCDQPVDLTCLYPTLLELCQLPADPECDGHSVVPLLQSPDAVWERPAIMTYHRGNHAVRSHRWRYIRYADGTEEFYDHQSDPDEWTNLANSSKHNTQLQSHRKWLPQNEASPTRDLKRPSQ